MSDVPRYAPLLLAVLLAACAQEPGPIELGEFPAVEPQPESRTQWESIPKERQGEHMLGIVEPGYAHFLEPVFVCQSREPGRIEVALPIIATGVGPARFRFRINGDAASAWIDAVPNEAVEGYTAVLGRDEADRLLLALRGARSAEMEEGGELHPIPLDGARAAIDRFRAACGLGFPRR